MAVVLYWKERLAARNPLRLEALRIVGFNVKPRRDRMEDPWPHSVAKQAMFEDYLVWFDQVYLPPFQEAEFYQDFPDQLPKPADQLEFFTTMSPFVHVLGRKQQTRSYFVPKVTGHEGRWITVKVYRNFVRLCEWEDHVAQFELLTGSDTEAPPIILKTPRIERIGNALRISMSQIASNKAELDRQMGKA